MTIQEVIQDAAKQFASISTTPKLDAEMIVAHAMQWQREFIFLHPGDTLTTKELALITPLVQKRLSGAPLAYVLGRKEFYGISFLVNEHVLVPRPETELLVDCALEIARDNDWAQPTIVDVCTGSGCIAITLKTRLRDARIIGTDISEDALDVARANDRANPTIELEWIESDLFDRLPRDLRGSIKLIVSNPPYVPAADVDSASGPLTGAIAHEPRQALVPQKDGHDTDALYTIESLVRAAPGWLAPDGVLLIEIGHDQGAQTEQLANHYFDSPAVTIHADLEGRDRVVEIRKR